MLFQVSDRNFWSQVTWKEIEAPADDLALKVTVMDQHSATRPTLGSCLVPLGLRANAAASKAEWHPLSDVRTPLR